jgi:hypothetical protein
VIRDCKATDMVRQTKELLATLLECLSLEYLDSLRFCEYYYLITLDVLCLNAVYDERKLKAERLKPFS